MARFQITYNGRDYLPLALPKEGRFNVKHGGRTFTNVGRDFVFERIFEGERPVIINLHDYVHENAPAYASENNDKGDNGPDGMGRRSA